MTLSAAAIIGTQDPASKSIPIIYGAYFMVTSRPMVIAVSF
jgi:hypothetical protein